MRETSRRRRWRRVVLGQITYLRLSFLLCTILGLVRFKHSKIHHTQEDWSVRYVSVCAPPSYSTGNGSLAENQSWNSSRTMACGECSAHE